MIYRSLVLVVCTLIILIPRETISIEEELVVQLHKPLGKIRGHVLYSANRNKFYAFQDVPYAQPPIKNNRFRTAKPLQAWNYILNTTENKRICPQQFLGYNKNAAVDSRETEDCLVLNVYTPVKPGSASSLPVLFWIHGGAYAFGSGIIDLYNPKYMIDYDIVVVTINYRLGVLGFLTTNDETLPANLGLKDQQFALQWTRDNIDVFGGNPKHIVVGGHSSGGMCVGNHLLSPSNLGLFKGVIQASGSPIAWTSTQFNYRERAFAFGKLLNPSYDYTNSTDLYQLLQKMPVDKIIKAQKEFHSSDSQLYEMNPTWKSIVEGDSSKHPFIIGPMDYAVSAGNFNHVPMLLTFTSEEYLIFHDEVSYKKMANNFDKDVRLLMFNIHNVMDENREVAGNELKEFYTSKLFTEDETAFLKFTSDDLFLRSVLRQAESASRYVPVYLFQISWDTNQGKIKGVQHAAELPYLWDFPLINYQVDETLRKPLLKLWTNFIKTLNPTPACDEILHNMIIPVVKPGNLTYLNLNRTFEILENPKNYAKLQSILNTYLQQPFITY